MADIFIQQIAPIIKLEAMARGYNYPSAIIAMACLESGYGKSGLAKNDCNYFGMKAGSNWKGPVATYQTKEQKPTGEYITITSKFRKYSNMVEGVKGFFDFIGGYARYSNLKSAKSPYNFLELIRADGYCTSLKYVTNVYNVILKNQLTYYDGKETQKMEPAEIHTTANLNLREEPNTSSKIILTIPNSAEILVDIPEFLPVVYNGQHGYVSSNYLNLKGAKYVRQ